MTSKRLNSCTPELLNFCTPLNKTWRLQKNATKAMPTNATDDPAPRNSPYRSLKQAVWQCEKGCLGAQNGTYRNALRARRLQKQRLFANNFYIFSCPPVVFHTAAACKQPVTKGRGSTWQIAESRINISPQSDGFSYIFRKFAKDKLTIT